MKQPGSVLVLCAVAAMAAARAEAAGITFAAYTNGCFYSGNSVCTPSGSSATETVTFDSLAFTDNTFSGTSSGGTLLDRWMFERNGERRTIDVKTRFFADDRTWLAEAACAGAGVVRIADVSLIRYLSSGALVPVLTDWTALEAPTIFAAYPLGQRRSMVLRAFLDFLIEVFAELDAARATPPEASVARVPKPAWFGRAHGRHSAYTGRPAHTNGRG